MMTVKFSVSFIKTPSLFSTVADSTAATPLAENSAAMSFTQTSLRDQHLHKTKRRLPKFRPSSIRHHTQLHAMGQQAENNDPSVLDEAILQVTPAISINPVTTKSNRKPKPKNENNAPNIYWRSISQNQLRLHPDYISLPATVNLRNESDLSLVRQHTAAWDGAHIGRLTSSILLAVLGLLEPEASKLTGLPLSWAGHTKSVEAWERLRAPALDLDQINKLISMHGSRNSREKGDEGNFEWSKTLRADGSVSYTPSTRKSKHSRRRGTKALYPPHPIPSFSSIQEVRMMWGSIQEPSAIYIAIDYFSRFGATVSEAGLAPFEALEITQPLVYNRYCTLFPSLPLLGSSPDGYVTWPSMEHRTEEGKTTMEPLEIKCRCPFASSSSSGRGHRRRHGKPRYFIRDQGPDTDLKPWYVFQLHLHMLCLGDACQSAVLLSFSATKGYTIFRLRRNQDFIHKMLFWIQKFNRDFVYEDVEPMVDFNSVPCELKESFQAFMSEAVNIAKGAELLVHEPQDKTPRSFSNADFFI